MDSISTQSRLSAELRWKTFCSVVLVFLLVCGLGFAIFQGLHHDSKTLLQNAQRDFLRGDYQNAEQNAAIVVSRDPDATKAALLAGNAAVKLNRATAALEYFASVPDNSPEGVEARCGAGDVFLLGLKQLSAAEEQFQRAYQTNSKSITANDRLAYLLGLCSRDWDANHYRLQLIRFNQFASIHLFVLCMGELAHQNKEVLDEYAAANPDDILVRLGLARNAIDQQQFMQSEKLLREVIDVEPELIEAHAKLGQVLLSTASDKQFLIWNAAVPQSGDLHPGIWTIRGTWLLRNGKTLEAVRCFAEAVRINPNHRRANYQLAQLLKQLGEKEQSQVFFERSNLLQAYFNTVKLAYLETNPEDMQKAAKLAESLGLIWEAYGWYLLVQRKYPHLLWAQEGVRRLGSELSHLDLMRTTETANPTRKFDFSKYPLPQWKTLSTGTDENKLELSQVSPIHFVDRASDASLEFQYFNGSDPDNPGHKMYEFTGGGVAVVDFDADGWPDIYLTQGSDWPTAEDQQTHLDRLFRNQGDDTFSEVTVDANVFENRFSQGVTSGDFNNDGFPDLYIANINGNRFYENNGDGTFTDITIQSTVGGNQWSTSCLIADLNNDSNPDLYVVNYLSGKDLFQRICPDSEGVMRICPPRNFPAAQDQLYSNSGDGRFENLTAKSGITVPDGRGLGVVAADFDGSGRLNLFVANDAVPNFYFVHTKESGSKNPEFTEQGLAYGLALNENGDPEGCMGIAAGDANHDGLLDLFVTNFYNESNTLFLQSKSNTFNDDTRQSGLQKPSLKMLGFGTQFVDANLDGQPDLIVVNGDVDDNRDTGRSYRMPPQFFQNTGDAKFIELPAQSLGAYFKKTYLGRSMARLDWNRDGKEDVVISHLDTPVALLTNETENCGNYLAVRLIGIRSARDAIGTIVTAEIGERKLVQQLTAGDGYQASNERKLIFGLDASERIDQLTLLWPSGIEQTFQNVQGNQEYLVLESNGLFRLND